MLDPDYSPEEEESFAKGLRNSILPSVFVWLAVIGVGLSLCSTSFAQSTTSNAGAAAQAGAQAGSQAGSMSGAAINQVFTGPPTQRQIIDQTFSGSTTNRLEGTQTIRNVPQVYAPALGGTNPCSTGASAGGAVAGFGITIGGQWSDQDCERRNAAALLYNTGQPNRAQEVLCGSTQIREARRRLAALGQDTLCAEDIIAQQNAARAAAGNAPAPVLVPASASVPFQQVVGGGAVPPGVPAAARTRPDWCTTASAAELRRYRSTCG